MRRPSCDHAGCKFREHIIGQLAQRTRRHVRNVEIGGAGRRLPRTAIDAAVGRPGWATIPARGDENRISRSGAAIARVYDLQGGATLPHGGEREPAPIAGSRLQPNAAAEGCRTWRWRRWWQACGAPGRSSHRRETDRATRRSRSEKNTARVPSGLSDGPICMWLRVQLLVAIPRPQRASPELLMHGLAPVGVQQVELPRRWRDGMRSLSRRCFRPGFSAFSTMDRPEGSTQEVRPKRVAEHARRHLACRSSDLLGNAAHSVQASRTHTEDSRWSAIRATGYQPFPR